MTLTVTESIHTPGSETSARARRPAPPSEGVAASFASLGTAASDAVSATVSFSSQAVHALEHAAAVAVDGIEDVAVGTWHAVEHAATEVADATQTVARHLGHYAEVGFHATGDAVSEVASGTVMAAAAGGKALMAVL